MFLINAKIKIRKLVEIFSKRVELYFSPQVMIRQFKIGQDRCGSLMKKTQVNTKKLSIKSSHLENHCVHMIVLPKLMDRVYIYFSVTEH